MTPDFAVRLLEDSPDAVIAIDTEGCVLYWSKGAEALFGYERSETVGRSLHEMVVIPELLDRERNILRQVVATGVDNYESLRRRKDGSLIYVAISGKAVRAADGRIEFILLTKKDVTQLKTMRDAKLVDARFREVLEAMPDGIVMVNSAGRIVFSNRQAETLFGYPAGALRGKTIEMLLPERYRGQHPRYRNGFFADPRVRPMGMGLELYGLRQDGSEFPVEISLSPVETEEGRLVSSAIRDITERKRFQRALEEKNLELEKASLAKDRFLASMSHELRTPLNAIIGFTGTLLMKLPGELNAEQEKQLNTILRSARHLLSLINDLLDLVKIESGKVEINFEPVSCRGVVEEVAAALRPLAEQKGLAFEVLLPPEEVVLQTDRRALSQVVINLANNAIKYTERGKVGIALVRRSDRGDPRIEISVRDTGCGIRPEEQGRLFHAFTQVDSTSARRFEGTGLGLYLSQKLAGLLGGRIVFESEFGKGSTFTLVLPDKAD